MLLCLTNIYLHLNLVKHIINVNSFDEIYSQPNNIVVCNLIKYNLRL